MKRNIYRYFIKIFIVLLLSSCVIFETQAIFRNADEYTIKAAFIERFTRFIEWPESSSLFKSNSTFILGVIGDDIAIQNFKKIYEIKTILNKKVEIVKIVRLNDIEKCNLIFIRNVKKEKLNNILQFVAKKPILTISDSKGFAKKGVMINFKFENDKISYEINQHAYIKSGFVFSYLLLQRGHIINMKENIS